MKPAPVGFQALLARMPRWFVEHARKTEVRGRRRRAALAARFELAYAPLAARAPSPPASGTPAALATSAAGWPDTVVAVWQHH